ncbi:MAG: amino acid ABC transporter permease [Actinomycetota bacterium]
MSGGPGLADYQPGDPRLDPGGRGSKVLGPLRAEGARGVAIATISTVVVLVAIVVGVLHSPHWLEFKRSFFDGAEFRKTFPDVVRAFRHNIEWFLIAEPIILVVALLLAVMRSLPGPVFFPLRLIATIYVDVFRGLPTILVIYLLGFGVPALQIPGLPTSGAFWAMVGVILSYSAYVAEVYRAGIESVHASQTAAARSLGLSRWQTLTFVVVPQAVRRVIPPLLNDFIALQKDTALVAIVAGTVPEAFLQAQIYQSGDFNFTPILGAALCFLVITIPLTRFTDWLVGRQRQKRQTGAAL